MSALYVKNYLSFLILHIIKKVKLFPVIFTLFILFRNSYAQKSDIIFEQIFLQHGLSQSIVKCICQDKQGFLYFGTEDGLNKYDGYKFTVIRHNPEDNNSLSYNDITALCVDRNGIIWVGTFNAGLNKYDPVTEKIIRFRHISEDTNSLSNNNINCIYEDINGGIWIGTNNGLNKLLPSDSTQNNYTFTHFLNSSNNSKLAGKNIIHSICQDYKGTIWVGSENGLYKLDLSNNGEPKNKLIRFSHDKADAWSLSNNIVRSIFEDSQQNIWIGTDNGLNKLEKRKEGSYNFRNYKNKISDRQSLNNNQIYAICEDNPGNLWIGTNGGGINIFDRNNEKFVSYLHDPQNLRSISYNEIRAIYKDYSGIIWIGSYGGGIDKVSRGVNQFNLYSYSPHSGNGISHPIVWAIFADKDSILWIGTHGGGLDKLDRKTNRYSHFVHDRKNTLSLSSNIVRVIFEDSRGKMWIGTHGGGINIFDRITNKFRAFHHNEKDPASLAHDEIRSIYEDKSGTIWIGTYGYGLDKFSRKDNKFIHFKNEPNNTSSLSNNFVRVIFEDSGGNFWIGTEGGGLNKFDRKSGKFRAYKSNINDSSSISNDYIFSIFEDSDGYLWLGTWGGGLNKFDPKSEKFIHYTTKHGLLSNSIYGILEDEKGNFWLSTNYGISKFNKKTETFKNYNERDGLQSNEFNGGSYFKSKNGEMFFGGIKGFNSFFPSQIKDNNYIPPIVITSFQKFNREVKLNKTTSFVKQIELSYKDYVFSFEFASLDFYAPEKNKYAYKMEGLDKNWIQTSSGKRFANYTTLPAGNYIFRVKGSNSDGIWNENGTSIILFISPPFWKTWWFTVLIFVVLAFITYVFYKNRLKNVRLKTELKTAHDAQMSIMPHSDPKIKGLDISSICIPANEVGGDFFDYFWTKENSSKLGIMIGDVSGKAMNAAMTAVMTSGMLITEANNAESLSTILSRVNIPLYSKTTKKMFTAVCLACIDPENKEMIFTNAGLTNPMIKTNGNIKYLKADGPRFPLGMMKDVKYEEKKLKLESGSLIIFMTDGVTEARNHSKEFYSEQRLENLILNLNTHGMSAGEIKRTIIKDISNFSGKHIQHDDMTLIVLKLL